MLEGNFVKIFNSTQTFKNVFVLKFELILIIGSNNVLTEGARKVPYIAGAALDRAGVNNVGSLTSDNPVGLQGLER
jgi:hypothetical protein